MSACRKTGIYAALALMILSAAVNPVMAGRMMCAHSTVSVTAERVHDRESVCSAVQSGLAFLDSIGLGTPGRLNIAVTEQIAPHGDESVIGYYDGCENEIRLLDPASVGKGSRRNRPVFGVPLTPAIWRSFVVHELAHAAAQRSFAPGVPVHTASEYIAAVAQLATLPAAEREKIIGNYPELSAFEQPDEIIYIYYLIDPCRFSVKSYLHFSRPENGRGFIRRILQEGLPDE